MYEAILVILAVCIGFFIGRLYQHRFGGAMVYVHDVINDESDIVAFEDENFTRKPILQVPQIQVLERLIVSQDQKRIVFRPDSPIKVKTVFLWGDTDVLVQSIKTCGIEQLAVGGAPIQVFDSEGRTFEQLQKELVDSNTILNTINLTLPMLFPGDELDIRYDCGQVLNAAIWYSHSANS